MPKLEFPNNFLWGAATSAHQVEGNTHNNWSEWEIANAARLAQESERKFGSVPHWGRIRAEATDPKNYISGLAADHYHRFREDFDIAKQLGHSAHRLSLEWSRIEPQEGQFDEVAIAHYREVLQALKDRGIEPFLTLWHWTDPLWITKKGGWENRDTVKAFAAYAKRMVEEYRDLVHFWMPLNEPGTFVGMSYIQGAFPPQKRLALWSANRVFKNLMQAYRETYRLIHQADSTAVVGMSHYAVYMFPHRNTLLNRGLVKILDYIRNWRFLDSINDTNDFIGIQYYHTDRILITPLCNGRWGFIDVKNGNEKISDMGWDIYPESIYHLIKRAARYGKPIYVTENGLADAADKLRARFIRDNLSWVHRAQSEGADVRGYFYWSLLDNFEWDKGFWPRFGLVGIDYATQKRTIRPSALEYAKICKTNSLEID